MDGQRASTSAPAFFASNPASSNAQHSRTAANQYLALKHQFYRDGAANYVTFGDEFPLLGRMMARLPGRTSIHWKLVSSWLLIASLLLSIFAQSEIAYHLFHEDSDTRRTRDAALMLLLFFKELSPLTACLFCCLLVLLFGALAIFIVPSYIAIRLCLDKLCSCCNSSDDDYIPQPSGYKSHKKRIIPKLASPSKSHSFSNIDVYSGTKGYSFCSVLIQSIKNIFSRYFKPFLALLFWQLLRQSSVLECILIIKRHHFDERGARLGPGDFYSKIAVVSNIGFNLFALSVADWNGPKASALLYTASIVSVLSFWHTIVIERAFLTRHTAFLKALGSGLLSKFETILLLEKQLEDLLGPENVNRRFVDELSVPNIALDTEESRRMRYMRWKVRSVYPLESGEITQFDRNISVTIDVSPEVQADNEKLAFEISSSPLADEETVAALDSNRENRSSYGSV